MRKRLRRLGAALCGLFLSTTAAHAGAVSVADLVDGRPARTLSSYNLFRDPARQIPNEGLVPYHLATPLFSDYAEKFRFVYMPPGSRASYDPDEVFAFPVGTIFVKTFAFPADLRRPDADLRVIETRLLVREADGWVAWPYVWNEEVTEATLKVTGRRLPLSFIDHEGMERTIRYQVPNKNQCKGCHAVGDDISLIGPKARNLNIAFPYAEGSENQLDYWHRAGLLEGGPARADDAPRVPVWDDPSTGSLDARARAYLDINCAHCHRLEGPASNSGLVLTYGNTDPFSRGVRKRPVAAGRGAGTADFVIEPGDPDASILVYRMESLEPGVAMPELSRAILHDEGIALVRAYIEGMADAAR